MVLSKDQESAPSAPKDLFRSDGFDWKNLMDGGILRFCDPFRHASSTPSTAKKINDDFVSMGDSSLKEVHGTPTKGSSTLQSSTMDSSEEEDDEDTMEDEYSTPTKAPLTHSLSPVTRRKIFDIAIDNDAGDNKTSTKKEFKNLLLASGVVSSSSSSLSLIERTPEGVVIISSFPSATKKDKENDPPMNMININSNNKSDMTIHKSQWNEQASLNLLLVVLVALWCVALQFNFQFLKF